MRARNARGLRGGGALGAGRFPVLLVVALALALLPGLGARPAAAAAASPVLKNPNPVVDESGSVTVEWKDDGDGAPATGQLRVTLWTEDHKLVGIGIAPNKSPGTYEFEGLTAFRGTRLTAEAETVGAGASRFNFNMKTEDGGYVADWSAEQVAAFAKTHGGPTPQCTLYVVPAALDVPPSRVVSMTDCPSELPRGGQFDVDLRSVADGDYVAVLQVSLGDGTNAISSAPFRVSGSPSSSSPTTTTPRTSTSPPSTSSTAASAPTTTAKRSDGVVDAADGVPASSTAPYGIGVVALLCGVLVLGAIVFVRRNRRAAGELDLGAAAPPVAPASSTTAPVAPPSAPETAVVPAPVLLVEGSAPVEDAVVSLPAGSIAIATDDVALDGDGVGRSAGRLEPVRTELGTTWGHEGAGLVVAALWLERRAGKGEDAEPSFAFDPSTGTGLLATYDGTGGSGAALAQVDADGAERSGAYVAGRLARRATETWFAQVVGGGAEAPPEVQLHDQLAQRFAHEGSIGVQSSEKFAGSLRRELPTTVAATVFRAGGDTVSLTALWAGDSRCHVLTPDAGMQQLSVDDTPIRDALEAITTDAPMSNLVSADRAFEIRRRDFEFARPVVLVSSTDGCFGYVATPAHFEYLLLESLQASTTAAEWAAKVLGQLDGFAGDDASLVLMAIGWPDFDAVRQAFATRAAFLRTQHWAPFDQVNPADRDQFSALRLASWRQYKQHYEEHLPRPNRPDLSAAAPTAAPTVPVSTAVPTAPAPALVVDPDEGRPVPER